MAALNVTQAGVNAAAREFDAPACSAVQYEKISSSMSVFSEAQLLGLRGKRIQVVRGLSGCSFGYAFSARVIAVVVPALDSLVEPSLLLLEDGDSSELMDYFDVSELRLVAVE
ncbi:hypothetical protein AB9A01_31995 [Pseudomonas aeruginosa]|uniref:hypothetical protein n=1 Tax=Pseudomonas aeruginosa TaxID=287 RepID=UPI001B367BC9|nr:hypothetical protein [Pseudomonas aeruginosa]MBQ0241324.1 hypothetical protein [Pseudomonas aeruginosa]MBQ0296507.1 hypothetical protein [Pseudomonas aeruginosa]MBT0641376.1 hypothetical protein [Pseudomonas aeruginosa]MBV6185050.1 hypothetical protein [Pseudomonas aeruginosa]MBV7720824.1 hypothetical protein [Pseudomonas aeruginosa]